MWLFLLPLSERQLRPEPPPGRARSSPLWRFLSVCRSWLNRRQINGCLNRTPAGFYDRVWQILERTPDGIIVAGKHLPQVQPPGSARRKGLPRGPAGGGQPSAVCLRTRVIPEADGRRLSQSESRLLFSVPLHEGPAFPSGNPVTWSVRSGRFVSPCSTCFEVPCRIGTASLLSFLGH